MTIKQIDQVLEEGESLKAITQVYAEIANLKIKRIRAAVERNRVFFQEISDVYALVKNSAEKYGIKTTVKPKKTVSIVLTSNYRFYGSINSDLLEYFVSTTSKLDTDRIMVNKAAIDYFRTQPVFSDYKEILLKDDQPDTDELLNLVSLLKDYKQVLVFYSRMKSLLHQVPTAVDITASPSTGNLVSLNVADLQVQQNEQGFKFIFEPDLPKVLEFFDSQIITLLLEGTFLESELSRTASRFISMDHAETEANKMIKENLTLKAYVKRSIDNNTILENFASMMAVRKT